MPVMLTVLLTCSGNIVYCLYKSGTDSLGRLSCHKTEIKLFVVLTVHYWHRVTLV